MPYLVELDIIPASSERLFLATDVKVIVPAPAMIVVTLICDVSHTPG